MVLLGKRFIGIELISDGFIPKKKKKKTLYTVYVSNFLRRERSNKNCGLKVLSYHKMMLQACTKIAKKKNIYTGFLMRYDRCIRHAYLIYM